MRIIICLFLCLALVVSFGIWRISLNTHLVNSRIERAEEEVSLIAQEFKGLEKHKEEESLSLDKFYPEIFNDIKQTCSYYHADSDIKIIGAKDFVNTQEFFKESQYKGIRYVDVLAQVDLKNQPDTYLFNMLYKMLKSRPIDVLEVRLEKNILNLTTRLFGP